MSQTPQKIHWQNLLGTVGIRKTKERETNKQIGRSRPASNDQTLKIKRNNQIEESQRKTEKQLCTFRQV